MNTGRFKKGHETWNKNMKGIHLSPDSQFKAGVNVGVEHPCWKGGEQVMASDCVYLYAGISKRVRRPRAIYEKHIGKIPHGFVVIHKDGDRYNDSPDNLIAISREQNMRRNAPNHKQGETK